MKSVNLPFTLERGTCKGTYEQRVEPGVSLLHLVQRRVDPGLAADTILRTRLVPVNLRPNRRSARPHDLHGTNGTDRLIDPLTDLDEKVGVDLERELWVVDRESQKGGREKQALSKAYIVDEAVTLDANEFFHTVADLRHLKAEL